TKCLDHREFVTKTPGSLQIKGLVDRLVRHVQVLPVRVLTAEPTGDLLWGTLMVEPIDDVGTNAWVIKTFAPMLLADLGGRGNGVGGRGTIGGMIRPGNNGDSEATERTSLSCPKRNTPSSFVRERSAWSSTPSKPTLVPAAVSSAVSVTSSV